jgi:hypothetical protein
MVYDNLMFPYMEKMLVLSRSWSTYIDLNRTGQIHCLDEGQINHSLACFSQTEHKMGSIYKRRNEFNLAEDYFQRPVSYARLYKGKEEMETDSLLAALINLYEIYRNQGKFDEASILSKRPIIVLLLLVIRSILWYRGQPVRSLNVSSIRETLTMQKRLHS